MISMKFEDELFTNLLTASEKRSHEKYYDLRLISSHFQESLTPKFFKFFAHFILDNTDLSLCEDRGKLENFSGRSVTRFYSLDDALTSLTSLNPSLTQKHLSLSLKNELNSDFIIQNGEQVWSNQWIFETKLPLIVYFENLGAYLFSDQKLPSREPTLSHHILSTTIDWMISPFLWSPLGKYIKIKNQINESLKDQEFNNLGLVYQLNLMNKPELLLKISNSSFKTTIDKHLLSFSIPLTISDKILSELCQILKS